MSVRSRILHQRGSIPVRRWSICVLLTWAFVGLLVAAAVADAVVCFQCATTDAQGDCATDVQGLLNASKGIEANARVYVKDCEASRQGHDWDRCFIERQYRDSNILVLFHRGCHANTANSSNLLLRNIAANNFTSCEFRKSGKNILSCISFCTERLCNGPQLPPPPPANNCTGNETDFCGGLFLRPDEAAPLTYLCLLIFIVFHCRLLSS